MELSPIRAFSEVMRSGSFAEVARAYGVVPSSVSRAVAALESQLGVRLIYRTTRSMAPTEAGLAYYRRIERILDKLREAEASISQHREVPSGEVRMSCPTAFGQRQVVPLVPAFAAANPAVSFNLRLTDGAANGPDADAEVTLHIGTQPIERGRAEYLCDLTHCLVSSPTYLDDHGVPSTGSDLRKHTLLSSSVPGETTWYVHRPNGTIEPIRVRPSFCASNESVLADCCAAGMGIALLPRWLVGERIRNGALHPLLDNTDASPSTEAAGAWAIVQAGRFVAPVTRKFIDYLSIELPRAQERVCGRAAK